MKLFSQLTHRGQARRLRQMALSALDEYALSIKSVRLLAYHFNAIFRVDTLEGQKYVLRINIPGGRTLEEIRSEMLWLAALRRETDLVVPQPLPGRAGQLVTTATHPGVPEPRHCVVFGWVPGRDLARQISPENYRRLGELAARLHDHAAGWQPPEDFALKKLDRVLPFNHGEALFEANGHPLLSPEKTAVFRQTAQSVQAALERLYSGRASPYVLHADLHQGNLRLLRGQLGVLDFDDSMLGYPVQDIAITFYYIQEHPEYLSLRQAFRQGYARRRAWPESRPGELETLIVWRELQLANFLLQSSNPLFEPMLPKFMARAEQRLETFLEKYS